MTAVITRSRVRNNPLSMLTIMLNTIERTYAYVLICALAVIGGCNSESPTALSERLTFVGRLERGAAVHVVVYRGSDTISGTSLSLSATPVDAVTIGGDGTVTLLRAGSLTVRAKLQDGKTVTSTVNVSVPPSIVFDLSVDGHRAIYRAALDGEDLARLSSVIGTNMHPTVAGELVVFTSFRSGQADLYSVLLTDSTERQITALAGNETEPALSPDGRRLAFIRDNSGAGRVWISSSDGSGPVRLTSITDPSPEAAPAWSNDGRLLFTSTEFGSADLGLASASVPPVVTFLDSANTRSAEVEGAWNASGTRVAFVSTRSGNPQLYVLEVASGIVKLIAGAGSNVAQPIWLTDGRIVFAAFKAGVRSLAWVDPQEEADVVHTIPLPNGNPQNPAAVR